MKELFIQRAKLIPESAHTNYAIIPKPPRLIEKAITSPLEVIIEISPFIDDIRDTHLPNWLRTAIINENSIYTDADQQLALIDFSENLLLLTDALLAIGNQNLKGEVLPPGCDNSTQPILLNEEQLINPMSVVHDFCKRYPRDFTRRELWHFLEAGVTHPGEYPTGFCPSFALLSYDYLNCLTEAAYSLTIQE